MFQFHIWSSCPVAFYLQSAIIFQNCRCSLSIWYLQIFSTFLVTGQSCLVMDTHAKWLGIEIWLSFVKLFIVSVNSMHGHEFWSKSWTPLSTFEPPQWVCIIIVLHRNYHNGVYNKSQSSAFISNFKVWLEGIFGSCHNSWPIRTYWWEPIAWRTDTFFYFFWHKYHFLKFHNWGFKSLTSEHKRSRSGLYFWKRGQQSTGEFLLASRQMRSRGIPTLNIRY